MTLPLAALQLRRVATDEWAMWRPSRACQAALAAGALLIITSTSAFAAAPPARLTPLAYLPGPVGDECPAAADVGRETAADGMARGLHAATQSLNPWTDGTPVLRRAFEEPIVLALLCEARPAGSSTAPLGAFGGDVTIGANLRDVAGPGLRALRIDPTTKPPIGLRAGDRLELPPSTNATLDVSVHTTGGLVTTRLGPFTGRPTTVTVSGPPSAPTVRVRKDDGSESVSEIAALSASRPTLRVTPHGRRLRALIRTTPGSAVFFGEPRGSGRRAYTYVHSASPKTTDRRGRLALTTPPIERGTKQLVAFAYDPQRIVAARWRCRLSWRADAIVRTRCRAEAVQPNGAAAALRSSQASRSPTPIAPADQADAVAARARQSLGLAGRRTVAIAPGAPDPPRIGFIAARDVTGDGLPEFILDSSTEETDLFVSSPGGWRAATVTGRGDGVGFVEDLDGDGLADLWLAGGRSIAGRADWSTAAAAPTIDLSPSLALGPRDLALPQLAEESPFEVVGPAVLPDATGDGRGEIIVAGAVIASEHMPLGRATQAPERLKVRTPAVWRSVATAIAKRDLGLIDDPGVAAGGTLFRSRGQAPLNADTTIQAAANDYTTTVHLRAHAIDAQVTTSLATLSVPGRGEVTDGDAHSGEVALATFHEACSRAERCTTRLRRVDRSGRVLATASRHERMKASDIAGVYVADGPDADDRPELLIWLGPKAPLRVWSSTLPSAELEALPPLTIAGRTVLTPSAPLPWRDSERPRGAVAIERDADHAEGLSLLELER